MNEPLEGGGPMYGQIAPQSAFLAGGERMMPDVPAIP